MAKGRYPLAAEYIGQMLSEPGFTPIGLADSVGVAVQQVYRWRDGDTTPDPKHWGRIEAYFGQPGAISRLHGLESPSPLPTYAQRIEAIERRLAVLEAERGGQVVRLRPAEPEPDDERRMAAKGKTPKLPPTRPAAKPRGSTPEPGDP